MKTTKVLFGVLTIGFGVICCQIHAQSQFSTFLFVATTGSDTLGNGSSNAPYATIQKAVDTAPANGALIAVLPGTYSGAGNYSINLEGKAVTIQSIGGAGVTTLNCQQNQAFIAHSTETTNTVIDGFTITNGFVSSGQDWYGSGIIFIVPPAGLTIRNCIFTQNSTTATYVTTSMGIITAAYGTNVITVENCLFYANSVGGGGWTSVGGGAAFIIGNFGGTSMTVINCTIANNNIYSSASDQGNYGGGWRGAILNVNGVTENTIAWGNSPPHVPSGGPYTAYVMWCTLVGYSIADGLTATNGIGVTNSNPLFVNPAAGDFSTASNSPARNAGDPSLPNNPDGTRSDIGWRADRFVSFFQPLISVQPQSTTNNIGDNVTFSVAAINNVPLTYQWYFDNNPVNNATNSSLTVSNVWQVNVGDYFAVVSAWSGSVTSSVASLVIDGVPDWINYGLVAFYPFNGNANDYSGNSNDCTPAGGVSYGTNRFGVPSRCLQLDGVDAYVTTTNMPLLNNAFSYTGWIKVDGNSPWEQSFAFYGVNDEPTTGVDQLWNFTYDPPNSRWDFWDRSQIDWEFPVNPNRDPTKNWAFVAIVYGDGYASTFVNGVLESSSPVTLPLPVINNRRLTFGASYPVYAQVFNGRIDDVRVYNLALSSNEVTQLYVYESGTNPPSIAGQPQSVVVNAHDTASFTVTAYGSPSLNYQWSLNGTNILGATSSSLTIPNVTQSALGTYTVVVSNNFGSVMSSNAVLSMYPFLAVPFGGVVTNWGQDAILSVQAWGTGPLSFQWFDDGVAILNGTNQTLDLSSIQFTNAGLYSVVVSNPFGSVTNTPEQVVVNPAGVSLGLYPGVTVSGTVGYTYIIQSTSDLSNTNSWVSVASLTLEVPIQLWVDISCNTASPTNTHRFYRVLPGQ